jgi:vitamin B12 transporter
MKRQVYILIIFFSSTFAYAQQIEDSLSYELPVFEVISYKWNVDLYSTASLDSTPVYLKLHNRISQGIRQAGNNYIRSYGPGRLTGYAIEGATSGQSLILWEDIPIQNPLNAFTDLSLYEYATFDELSQTANSDFTNLGNGSMVPALKFSSKAPKSEKSLQTALEMGSFGATTLKLQFEQNSKKWISKTSISNQSEKSNFKYERLNGETSRLEHAENQSFNLQHNQWLNHKNKNQSSLHLWFHSSQKNLPKPYASVDSKQLQEDEFLNICLKNKTQITKSVNLNSFVFYQINSNYYEDLDAEIFNDNRFQNIQIQSVVDLNSKIQTGIKSQIVQGTSENYPDRQQHFIQSIFANLKQQQLLKLVNFSAGLRTEYSNRFKTQVGGHIKFERQLNDKNKLNLIGERVFRYPTLNDLHWIPGGNEDLQTEEAFGFRLKYFFKKNLSSFRVNAFSRNTTNMIIWIPNSSFWAPENIQSVWARGIELNAQHILTKQKFNTGITAKTALTKATNLKRINSLDNSKNKQLIYTPQWTGFWTVFASWKSNQISLNQELQSRQYTNRDNTQYLDGFTLTNIRLSKQLKLPKALWSFGLNINNIFGTDYQLNRGWPMPRQNFQFQISYKTLQE